jgi:hypothetical protein
MLLFQYFPAIPITLRTLPVSLVDFRLSYGFSLRCGW